MMRLERQRRGTMEGRAARAVPAARPCRAKTPCVTSLWKQRASMCQRQPKRRPEGLDAPTTKPDRRCACVPTTKPLLTQRWMPSRTQKLPDPRQHTSPAALIRQEAAFHWHRLANKNNSNNISERGNLRSPVAPQGRNHSESVTVELCNTTESIFGACEMQQRRRKRAPTKTRRSQRRKHKHTARPPSEGAGRLPCDRGAIKKEEGPTSTAKRAAQCQRDSSSRACRAALYNLRSSRGIPNAHAPGNMLMHASPCTSPHSPCTRRRPLETSAPGSPPAPVGGAPLGNDATCPHR